jgi:hypothetical protein
MPTLYILTGPPRAAKTTIMNSLVAKTQVQLIATDALEHGLRNVLTGQPHQLLQNITLKGTAEKKTSLTEIGGTVSFSNNGTESELLLQAIAGMLDYYRRNKESAAFEGTECSPDWVASLVLPGFKITAAFVGYTHISHADTILAHAKQHTRDWINEWLAQERGDDTKIRAWVHKQTEQCKTLKAAAEARGFPFFDISAQPFAAYKAAVLNYFLKPR